MGSNTYSTKLYWIHRGNETVTHSTNVVSASGSSQLSTSAVAFVGPVRYSINGTVGGATVKVQVLDPSSTYVDIAGTTATGVVDQIIDFPAFTSNTVKAIIASASSNTDMNIWFQGGLGG